MTDLKKRKREDENTTDNCDKRKLCTPSENAHHTPSENTHSQTEAAKIVPDDDESAKIVPDQTVPDDAAPEHNNNSKVTTVEALQVTTIRDGHLNVCEVQGALYGGIAIISSEPTSQKPDEHYSNDGAISSPMTIDDPHWTCERSSNLGATVFGTAFELCGPE